MESVYGGTWPVHGYEYGFFSIKHKGNNYVSSGHMKGSNGLHIETYFKLVTSDEL